MSFGCSIPPDGYSDTLIGVRPVKDTGWTNREQE